MIDYEISKRGIKHAIYWKLHQAYLTNDRKESQKYFGMLTEYSDEQIESEITTPHFLRFQKIRANILDNQFGRLYGSGFNVPTLAPSYAPIQKSCEEKEFCKKLFTTEGREKLSSILNVDNLSLLDEFDLGTYGRLDLFGKSGRTVFAIEVKVGLAPNSLVSQIDRYRLALELQMNFGLFDEVKAYVLAERFTTYEAIELSRLSVNMIEHRGTIDSLTVL